MVNVRICDLQWGAEFYWLGFRSVKTPSVYATFSPHTIVQIFSNN